MPKTDSCHHLRRLLVSFLILMAALPPALSRAEELPLAAFAKLPLFNNIKVSPSGTYLAATVRNADEEESLVFMDLKSKQVETVIKGRKRERITNYIWATDERVVIWLGRKYGSLAAPYPTDMVTAVDWNGENRRWLLGKAKGGNVAFDRSFRVASLLHRLPDDDEHILITVNDYGNRKGSFTEILKLNIHTGWTRRIDKAPMRDAQIVADNDGNVRLSVAVDPDKDNAVVIHELQDEDWQVLGEYDTRKGNLTPVGFNADNSRVYMLDNRDTDRNSLYLYDPKTHKQELVYEPSVVDIERVDRAPDGEVVGVTIEPDYPDFVAINPQHAVSKSLAILHQALRGYRVEPTSVTSDGRLAVIRASSDRMPGQYFLFDTVANSLSSIASVMPWLDEEQLRPMEPYALKVRDGTDLYAYLTRPDDSAGPHPLVVMPHGGPHGIRDYWAYDAYVQMLASRGYAVLQVNFRGSGGYGRDFMYQGYGKWGTLMQDDLTDATKWAISAGIADADGVCIFGGSYGGYAAMMGAVREPDLYQCVIAYVGVYDLELMFEKGDIPTRETGEVFLRQAVGEDKEDMRARSPVHNLEKVKAPVFIVHGAEDFRVDIEHAYRLRDGLKKLGKPYEWMVKPNEGHGFYKPDNREELFERMLEFLGRHIGNTEGAAQN